MCNLYSMTTNQKAIRDLFKVVKDFAGNLPALPAIFPDAEAPVVRNGSGGRELIRMRWDMPSPPQFAGPPITNIRNTASPQGDAGDPDDRGRARRLDAGAVGRGESITTTIARQ